MIWRVIISKAEWNFLEVLRGRYIQLIKLSLDLPFWKDWIYLLTLLLKPNKYFKNEKNKPLFKKIHLCNKVFLKAVDIISKFPLNIFQIRHIIFCNLKKKSFKEIEAKQ